MSRTTIRQLYLSEQISYKAFIELCARYNIDPSSDKGRNSTERKHK